MSELPGPARHLQRVGGARQPGVVDIDPGWDRTIEWLSAGDPSVRWQVMRDLLGQPEDQVAVERARVATEGWGAQLLAAQDPDGGWAGALYSPKWTSTTYTLLLLERLGLERGDARALAGCRHLWDGARWYGCGYVTRLARGCQVLAGISAVCVALVAMRRPRPVRGDHPVAVRA